MVETVIAEPIGNSVPIIPQGMAINPVFDWQPLLGTPLWVFVDIVLVAAIVLVIIYYVRKIKRLDSVRGWLDSQKEMGQDTMQTWVISRTQRLTIICMQIKDNVLSFNDWSRIEMWFHNSPFARIIVGGLPGLVVSDDYHFTRDFIAEIAFTYNCDIFNKQQDLLAESLKKKYEEDKKRGVESDKPVVVKPITDFASFDSHGKKCLFHLYPDGLPYPVYAQAMPMKIAKYIPLGNSASHLGGDIIEDSRDFRIRTRDPGFMEKYAILGICTTIGLVAIIAAWFVPLGGA